MSALLGVVVGGAIAAVVQWFVTPRVQRRIRAQERQEESLRELGRILTEDIPRVRSRLMSACSAIALTKQLVDSGVVDKTSPRFNERAQRDTDDLHSAVEDWRRLSGGRLEWLMDQIGERRGIQHRKYQLAAVMVPMITYDCERLSDDEREKRWEDEYAARRALLAYLEDKGRAIDPNRPSLPSRARQAVVGKLGQLKRGTKPASTAS